MSIESALSALSLTESTKDAANAPLSTVNTIIESAVIQSMVDTLYAQIRKQEAAILDKQQEPQDKPVDTTILFHGNCIDGWFSAYFAYMALSVRGATVQMFPIAPSQRNTWPDPSVMERTTIWLLDISVAEEYRDEWMKEGALNIYCIDHHASAVEHWDGDKIDTTACAAVQTHRHFFPHLPIPEWLHSIDRVDRWTNVTYEDRCLREFFSEISAMPVAKRLNEAIVATNHFLHGCQTNYAATMEAACAKGKALLEKKDKNLMEIMARHGKLVVVDDAALTAWKLPAAWLDKTLLLMDTTEIVLDTTEAAHLAFEDDPKIDVFINYRKKTYYDVPHGAKPHQRHEMIVYSARSRTLDLTTDTIFEGHLTAAGASLTIGRAEHFPFLLNQGIVQQQQHKRRPRIVNPVKTPIIKHTPKK